MSSFFHLQGLARCFAAVAASASAAPAFAMPTLHCQVGQAGEVLSVDVRPGANPYDFKAVDIRGNFRFRAVVIGDERTIEYIKLYTYYQTRQQPVLMHQVKYLAPAMPGVGRTVPLTGVVQLFSPRLGREIQYSCTLVEAGT
ncbi:MAG: hypothetical protein KJ787_14565 [Gammaproteobacteria bacterium]|nr:hypothetical protein [Gammaproteobacteria bacterium]MBU1647553.1 hypothetical protein [Gammaproteobacteria bacterium]MBU1973002.1 hypothetical protein [Gammaproteobacteria bacterium]